MSGEEHPVRPDLRLSNAEREAIVDRLKVAQEEGRIDLLEFEERVERAYGALVASDLDGLLDDLPAEQPPAPTAPATRVVELEATAVGRQRWMFAVLSGRESRGRWAPGAPNRAITVLGGQTLDLTNIDATEVDIRAVTVLGELKIIVPPGAEVDLGGFILIGETTNKAHSEDGTSPMRVRVRSYGLIGECTVRTPSSGSKIKNIIKRKIRELE